MYIYQQGFLSISFALGFFLGVPAIRHPFAVTIFLGEDSAEPCAASGNTCFVDGLEAVCCFVVELWPDTFKPRPWIKLGLFVSCGKDMRLGVFFGLGDFGTAFAMAFSAGVDPERLKGVASKVDDGDCSLSVASEDSKPSTWLIDKTSSGKSQTGAFP